MSEKTAAVIGIGTEIMRGKIDDTNATFLCRWLARRGIRVALRVNAADTLADIKAALANAAACDLVIATGGLGPTADDLTREALAALTGKQLVFDERLWAGIKAFFARRTKTIPESNKRQAFTLPGAEALENPAGTAPGLWYEEGGRCYALLPGPPPENQPMIENALQKKLLARGLVAGALASRVFRCYGIGESALADLCRTQSFQSDVGWYFSQEGFVELHFSRYDDARGEGKRMVEADAATARAMLTVHRVFFTPDAALGKLLLDALTARKLTIAFGESITGGAMAAEFVKNPGASRALAGGIVAYSNRLKISLLEVSPETLADCGAVSEETAREMAWGLRRAAGADVCVSASGIAGPDGGGGAKPVGLTHFGFVVGDKFFHRKEVLFGGRERIIKRATAFAFGEVLKEISRLPENSSPPQ